MISAFSWVAEIFAFGLERENPEVFGTYDARAAAKRKDTVFMADQMFGAIVPGMMTIIWMINDEGAEGKGRIGS